MLYDKIKDKLKMHITNTQKPLSLAAIAISLIALTLNFSGINPLGAAVTSVAGTDNLLLNGQFKAKDYGSAPISSQTGTGVFFNTCWRVKHLYNSTSATMQQIDDFHGGTRLTFSNTESEFFYVRQAIPDVMQFSGKTFTVRADIGSATPGLYYDFYVNARWNNNDVVPVIDTGQPVLSAGAQTTTFSVPDLSGYSYDEDYNGGLEVAFRVYSPDPQTNAVVDISSIALYEGSNLSTKPISNYDDERPILNSFYEKSGYTTGVVGLDPSTGQKRATFYMTAHKRRGTSYKLKFYDALGNEGRVSTYSQSGARVDNIVPDSVRHSSNAIIFVFYETNISGIGLSWVADAEG